jgi:hypothetical protein
VADGRVVAGVVVLAEAVAHEEGALLGDVDERRVVGVGRVRGDQAGRHAAEVDRELALKHYVSGHDDGVLPGRELLGKALGRADVRAARVGRVREDSARLEQVLVRLFPGDREAGDGAHAKAVVPVPVRKRGEVGKRKARRDELAVEVRNVARRVARVDGKREAIPTHERQHGTVKLLDVREIGYALRQANERHGASLRTCPKWSNPGTALKK